jgi:hypothetical protein
VREDCIDALYGCERFDESSGEGGGVYRREDGEYIRLADCEAAIRALKSAATQTTEGAGK